MKKFRLIVQKARKHATAMGHIGEKHRDEVARIVTEKLQKL